MRSLAIFFNVLLVHFCVGFNTTEKYLRINNPFGGRRKEGRLIHFDSNKGEIEVELEFAIPFISLPVKESLQMGRSFIAHVNTGAIALAGGVIFAFTILTPATIQLLSKTVCAPRTRGSHQRSDIFPTWRYVTALDDLLLDNNIDSTSCMQRFVCWTVKSASKKVNAGRGSSTDKLLDGFASNEYIIQYIEGSAIEDAIKNGYKEINCSREYDKCQVTQQTIHGLTKFILKALNGMA